MFRVKINYLTLYEKMSVALREAGTHSLVILDEFGVGSSPLDSCVIFISCLEYWMNRNAHSPLVLASTHLHNAIDYLSQEPRYTILFSSMKFLLHENQLVFLYQITEDTCSDSFPLSIAYASGLPDFVVCRTQEVIMKSIT